MPPYRSGMPERDHLKRLSKTWIRNPLYFLTTCTDQRRRILTTPGIPEMLIASWRASLGINGWAIGRYVVMPDHVHFFAKPMTGAKLLSVFMRDWKRWTSGEIRRTRPLTPTVWQSEFFDHVLRSPRSYDQKWEYVRENPVRAGLVPKADGWPHAGECERLHF
ncbi:MAG: REP-associated tyrosine transposase [Verrucomicrobiota bacterium]